MRALYVPVRLAATVMAVAAAAGCMSVGNDGDDRPGPSHSAGHRAGEEPDGGTSVGGGGIGSHGGKGGKGHKGSPKPGESESGDASPSASASKGGKPSAKATDKGGGDPSTDPVPPGEPTPTRTTAEPTPEPPPVSTPPSSDPGSAEPSSSAHEQPATQLVQREPHPRPARPSRLLTAAKGVLTWAYGVGFAFRGGGCVWW